MTHERGRTTAAATLKKESFDNAETTKLGAVSRWHHLVVTHPPGAYLDKTFALDRPSLLIGRGSECDIVIDEDEISRRHARLESDGSTWTLTDLDSTNGTFVDGEQVSSARVRAGAAIQLSKIELRLLRPGDPELERFEAKYAHARLDKATGLPNRRVFDEEIGRLLRRELRDPIELGIALVELDFLERWNSRYGHSVGDVLLAQFAARLQQAGRDAFYRHAGGRFAYVLDAADVEHAKTFASAVQALVSSSPFEVAGEALAVSASVGYMVARLGTRPESSELVTCAERELRRATKLGGGQSAGSDYTQSFAAGKGRRRNLEETGVFRTATKSTTLFPFEPLVFFERELKPGSLVFALCIEGRQVIEANDSGALFGLDKILQSALEQVCTVEAGRFDEECVTNVDLPTGARITVGHLPSGNVMLVALDRGSPDDAAAVASAIEEEFERLRDATGMIAARVISGPPVKVRSPHSSIGESVKALEVRQRAAERDQRLPLPIAWARRMALSERSPLEAFFHLRRLHQAITRWLLTVMVAEWMRKSAARTAPGQPILREALSRNVSEGTWVQLLRRVSGLAVTIPSPELVFPDLVAAIYPRGRKSPLLNELDAFASTRNRFSHGQENQAAQFVREWAPKLEQLLAGPLECLQRATPRQVLHARYRHGAFEIRYRDLVGDHTIIPPQTYISETPVEDGKVILVNDRTGQQLVLDPFCIYARCPQCELDEIFFLEGVDEGLAYASPREGQHTISDLTRIGKSFEEIAEMQDILEATLALL